MSGGWSDIDEFEQQYADELELLHEEEAINTPRPAPKTPSSTYLPSPQLSQISDASTQRRLFSSVPPAAKRYASTPFPSTSDSNGHQQRPPDPLAEIQNVGLQQNPRKRRLDEIFGDIDDIQEEELLEERRVLLPERGIDAVAKKLKSEEERDLETIDLIVAARRRLQEQMAVPKQTHIDRLEAMHAFKMQNLSHAAPRWPFVKLLRNDGERIYVRCHSEEFEENQLKEIRCSSLGNVAGGSLLGENKRAVWDAAGEINAARLLEQPDEVEAAPTAPAAAIDRELWVEKYRPRRYMDLLSDETCNRNLLKWIRLWDKAVFNRKPKIPDQQQHPKKPQQQLSTFNKRTGRFEQSGGWLKGRNKGQQQLNSDLDETERPVQKIALLCGPPGLGKTTLAHTVARHAGYDVREINASDDRTPEAFRQALESGTQMQSVFDEARRPNCIVLDEIDGAPTAAIDFLLRFAAGSVTQKSKKGGTKRVLLRRPIICICNDLYTPALRQLRLVAFVVTVPQTESARLVDRLMLIAESERIRVDQSALFALAEKTGNDIRSCLSLLQFLSCKKRQIGMMEIVKSNIGVKDQQKELFSIWNAIFQIQRPSKAILAPEYQDQMITTLTPNMRMQYVLQVINLGSDYDRLIQGIFENYLHQKQPDPNMRGFREAAEWFSFGDIVQTQINRTQNYSVYGYLPYTFVAWHFLFATLAWPRISYPSKGYEVAQKSANSRSILTAIRHGLDVTRVSFAENFARLFVDVIPFVRRILSPTLRAVSMQLLSPRERADIRHAVEVMADLGIAYIQLKAPDGTYQYQVEPDLGALLRLECGGVDVPVLSYWSKQLIAGEVKMEQARRVQAKTGGGGDVVEKKKAEGKKKAPTAIPNHLQRLMPTTVKTKKTPEVRKDFFGRLMSNQEQGSAKTDEVVKSPIWYRYKEGFNNAVRKPILMIDLL